MQFLSLKNSNKKSKLLLKTHWCFSLKTFWIQITKKILRLTNADDKAVLIWCCVQQIVRHMHWMLGNIVFRREMMIFWYLLAILWDWRRLWTWSLRENYPLTWPKVNKDPNIHLNTQKTKTMKYFSQDSNMRYVIFKVSLNSLYNQHPRYCYYRNLWKKRKKLE